MSAPRICAVLLVAATLAVGCGNDNGESPTVVASASSTAKSTTTTTAPANEQPAIWPAAGVVFTTPEDTAKDFVTKVLRVDPVLGAFQQGDSRSGEIEVFSPGEGGGGTRVVRGRLLLRQLGPDNGWFILAAANDNASITAPEQGAKVPAGALTVEGRARGFEANVVVRAFAAGDADRQFAQVITQGGALETPEPFTVSLDLSSATPGQVVMILVRGGTGLETDPGEFGAIAVVIAG